MVPARRHQLVFLVSAVLFLSGCSTDVRDIKLSEMQQPEYSKMLLEELTMDERDLLTRYIATHTVQRDIDFKLTVGEVLEIATEEKAASEKAKAEADAERVAQMEAQQKAQAAERDARLAQLLDHTVAQLRGPMGGQVLSELQRVVLTSTDVSANPKPMADQILLQRYVNSGLAEESMTLREALERVEQDSAGIEAQIKAAEAATLQQARLSSLLDHMRVAAYLNPSSGVRKEAEQVLSAEDFQLLEAYLPQGLRVPVTSPVFSITLRQALENAKQGKVAQ